MISLLQPHTVRIYDLAHKDYEVKDVPARSLLTGQRFDFFAKLYYIRNRKCSYEQALDIYCRHIKAFNPDLKEPGRKDKNGYDDFVKAFDTLIDDLGENGFNPEVSLIPVDENGIILDGAHRVAALAFANKPVRIVHFKNVYCKANFNYDYFLKRGLSWDAADTIAHEMVQWLPNMLIACLWPRMGGEAAKQQALTIINNRFPICYTKTITTNLDSFGLFIAKAYEAQAWIGTSENSYAGARDKALNCFAQNKQITFALFEANDLSDEEIIRQQFGSDKHSIHITDNIDETKEIAYVVFDAEQLAKWNRTSFTLLQKIQEYLHEQVFYFKHVVLINCKVAVAKVVTTIRNNLHKTW